jgi:diguanylate cyclase (GGDEF)-like protein
MTPQKAPAGIDPGSAPEPPVSHSDRRPSPIAPPLSPGPSPRRSKAAYGWLERQLIRSGVASRDHDVLLGFGLVASFCIIVVITAVALNLDSAMLGPIVGVSVVTLALDFGLVVLFRHHFSSRMLLCFPVLFATSELVLALVSDKGVAANYTAFFTLMFVYIGLTQPRGTGPLFVPLAASVWVLAQRPWTAAVGIKLCLTVAIWIVLSDVLAVRAARGRANTKRLVVQANTDVLTGLGSRLLLSDRIERLAEQTGPGHSALLFLDLDGFKMVNDTFGHAGGDELLVAVAKRIQATLRDGELAVRLGGDEFVALLDDCDLVRATVVADRLLSVVSSPYALSLGRVAVTASIGIVEITPPITAERALREADLAMYEAKSAGRNAVAVFEKDMHARTVRRLELETELRDALEADEFEVYYQPVIHTVTGAIVGAEALLRWRHPRRGLLAPDQFLAVAEEIGLMEPLGDWVLQRACAQAVEWQSIDPAKAFTMAVNLSAPEMFSADLVRRVEMVLDATGLPGRLLVVEITERVVMADCVRARQRLKELRKLGVRIAIDDFGTGYSSLAYLRELPIDILKIDRSFVTPLGSDHQALALLRSIIGIANALVLDVIVEGVETAAQVEFLDELGCHIVQGFYFGRPSTAEDLGGRLSWIPETSG